MTKSLNLSVTARVASGAVLLDDVFPGWHRYIIVRDLRMETLHSCILGQLWGSFHDGMRAVFPLDDPDNYRSHLSESIEHGFEITDDFEDRDEYALLDEAWMNEIVARGTFN